MLNKIHNFFVISFFLTSSFYLVQGCSKSEPVKKTEIPAKAETKQESKPVDVKEFLKDEPKKEEVKTVSESTGK